MLFSLVLVFKIYQDRKFFSSKEQEAEAKTLKSDLRILLSQEIVFSRIEECKSARGGTEVHQFESSYLRAQLSSYIVYGRSSPRNRTRIASNKIHV